MAARDGADFADELADRLSVVDESVLAAYVDGSPPDVPELLASLARATAAGRMHPVVFGAALTGVGVPDVLAAVATYLPAGRRLSRRSPARERLQDRAATRAATRSRTSGCAAAPSPRATTWSATTAARRRGDRGAGTGAAGGDVRRRRGHHRDDRRRRGHRHRGRACPTPRSATSSGAGTRRTGCASSRRPGLESVVVARDPADRARLFEAVQRLSAQDPLIDARLDGADQELTVSLYGEVQREVLTARLAEEFGIAAEVLESRTVHVERVAGVGEWALAGADRQRERGLPGRARAAGVRGEVRDGHRARVHPAGPPPRHRGGRAAGDGLRAARVAGRGLGGDAHQRAVQRADPSRRATTATSPRRRCAGRCATAGTRECEPVSAFEVEVPEESFTAVLHVLTAAGATPDLPVFAAGRCTVTGRIPTRSVHGVERGLPELTGGRGFLVSEPAGYERVGLAPDGAGARVAGERRPDQGEDGRHDDQPAEHVALRCPVASGGRSPRRSRSPKPVAIQRSVRGVALVLVDPVEELAGEVVEAGRCRRSCCR